jgi:hypothetical protein
LLSFLVSSRLGAAIAAECFSLSSILSYFITVRKIFSVSFSQFLVFPPGGFAWETSASSVPSSLASSGLRTFASRSSSASEPPAVSGGTDPLGMGRDTCACAGLGSFSLADHGVVRKSRRPFQLLL